MFNNTDQGAFCVYIVVQCSTFYFEQACYCREYLYVLIRELPAAWLFILWVSSQRRLVLKVNVFRMLSICLKQPLLSRCRLCGRRLCCVQVAQRVESLLPRTSRVF